MSAQTIKAEKFITDHFNDSQEPITVTVVHNGKHQIKLNKGENADAFLSKFRDDVEIEIEIAIGLERRRFGKNGDRASDWLTKAERGLP